MAQGNNRRDFIKTTAIAGAGYWAAGGVALKPSNAANEQVNIASIGVGGKGDSDSRDAGNNGNLVAICDIDDNNLNRKSIAFPKAKKFNDYRKMLDSPVADLKNIGGSYAGSLTAGLFLQEFVADGIPWAHLDIAGPAWTDTGTGDSTKGGTGYGVRTLVQLAKAF